METRDIAEATSMQEHGSNVQESMDTRTNDRVNGENISSMATSDVDDTLKSDYGVEYNLRRSSIINRILTEKRRNCPKQPKAKIKPPPLSKYRRRAANSRERGRMQEINVAFETLKNVIPDFTTVETNKSTKITTLRLALNYISALRRILGDEEDASDNSSISSGSSAAQMDGSMSPSGVESTDSMELISDEQDSLDSEGESLHHV